MGPNCRGSLLYWMGIITQERYAESSELEAALSDCTCTTLPEAGDIAIWRVQDLIIHAGVVIQQDLPPLIKSRMGVGGPIREIYVHRVLPQLGYSGPAMLIYYSHNV